MFVWHRCLIVAVCACLCLVALPASARKVQSTNAKANAERAQAVRDAFQSSFNDYLTYARGADELLPLTKKPAGGFGNWGATFIDALTTAHLMGLDDFVSQGVAFAKKVDFANTTQAEISLFETNIRYVASLVSLYELTGQADKDLIVQAQTIADRLLRGWKGDDAIPYNTLTQWTAGPSVDAKDGRAIIAEAGTLILEFDRLSKYTNNATYRTFAVKSMKAVIDSKAVLPGLYGQGINPKTNTPTDDYVTWGGGSDSFFEYLLKYGQLIGSTDTYIATWVDSVKSSIEYLLTKPGQTDTSFVQMADYSPSYGGKIPQFSHLGCFVGGNWILGGRLLNNEDVVNYGLQLTDGCANTYTSSVTGIGPEVYVFKTESGATNGVTIYDESFYNLHGFDYSSPGYILRPEVLESVFYAYRATGDAKWQDIAWQAFLNIKKYCKAPAAFAAISQVNATSPELINDSESFLYAELFKYLFLIFSDPNLISLDEYVFNTEAHPFKVDNVGADYSAVSFGTLPTPFKPDERSLQASKTSKQRNAPPKPLITGQGLLAQFTNLL